MRFPRAILPLIALTFAVPAFGGDVGPSERPLLVEQTHPFSRDEARHRVQQLVDYWSQRFGVQRQWRGDVVYVKGEVMGVEIDARLVIGEHEVRGQASDPGFLVRNAALDYVQRKLRKYLHPNYADR